MPGPPLFCEFVEIGLPIARPRELVALAIEEVVTMNDGAEPETVLTWIAPKQARVVYRGGDVLVDVEQGTVTSWDGESEAWIFEWLDEWEADAAAYASDMKERYIGGTPKFARMGQKRAFDMNCERYFVAAERRTAEGELEGVRQDLWVTRELKTTEAIAKMYMRLVSLVDRTWAELPIARPRGIVLQSVTSWRLASAPPRDPALSMTVRVESIDHVVIPQTFFDPPMVASPADYSAAKD
jgi:hypothetical protein